MSEKTVGDMFDFYDKLVLLNEIDELKASVNELRSLLEVIATTPPAELSIDALCLLAGKLLSKTPKQSLQAIKAEVEAETIERCVGRLQSLYCIDYEERNFFIDGIDCMPRKYE